MGGDCHQTASTPSPEQTVAIIPSGLVADPRCITNLDQCGKAIIRAIRPMYRRLDQAGTDLSHLVVGGPPCLAPVCDKYTTPAVNVSAHQSVGEQYLDDTRETGDGYEIPSVRMNRPRIASLLAREGRLSEHSIDQFDITDASDRARVTDTVIRKLSSCSAESRMQATGTLAERLVRPRTDRQPRSHSGG
jgi:hypothetical protein